MSNKITFLIGSPRINGNTHFVVNHFIEKLEMDKYENEIINLYDYNITGCIDCRLCKTGEKVCKVKDGMQELYSKIDSSDIIIFATPIYWFAAPGVMKLLIDRIRPYFYNKKLNGKIAAVLLTAGNGRKDCDLAGEMFKRIFMALDIDHVGTIKARGYDEGDVIKDKTALSKIVEIVERIKEHN